MKTDQEEEEMDVYLEVAKVEEEEDNPSTKMSLSVLDVTSYDIINMSV